MQRRELLTSAAAVGLALPFSQLTSAATAESLPIIDTHQHLWDLKKFQPPWLKDASDVISSTHATAEYLAATKGLNVKKAVYMEIDVAPADHTREAKHVIQLSQSDEHPTVAAVISGRPNQAGFEAYLKPLLGPGVIKGVRQVLHVPSAERGMCLQPTFVESMRMLGRYGLSFDLCMRPTELSDGAKLAKRCPDTRFIVDHCGNADPKAFVKEPAEEPWHDVKSWKKGIGQLAKRDNVICKISGVIARSIPNRDHAEQLAPIVNFCLDEFGADRVVFGSDWPVCKLGGSLRQWVTALRQIISERPEAEQRKLLYDNAQRIYSLS